MSNTLSGFDLFKINKGISAHFSRKNYNYFKQGFPDIAISDYNRNYLKRFYEIWAADKYDKNYFEAVCFSMSAYGRKIDYHLFREKEFHNDIFTMISNPVEWFSQRTILNSDRRRVISQREHLYGQGLGCPEFAANNCQESYGYTGVQYLSVCDIISNGEYLNKLELSNKDNYFIQTLVELIRKSKLMFSLESEVCNKMLKVFNQYNGGDLVLTK